MSFKEFGVLISLGAIWGASFMFIKVAGAELQPFALVEVRLGLAALVLLAAAATQPGIYAAIRANWKPILVMGTINCAIPYTLITWGETYISSGLAAIYNACAPLWAAVLGLFWVWGERLSPGRLLGVLLGMAGVVLIVSGDLKGGSESGSQLLGQGAVLAAALFYAISGIYGRRMLPGVPPLAPAAGQLAAGAVILLPLALFQLPGTLPSWEALGSLAALSVAGTALASMLFYWLLARVGAAKTLLVTYLLPGFALLWGALFLREAVTVVAVLGLALVLVGITVTSGRGAPLYARLRRRVGRAPAQP